MKYLITSFIITLLLFPIAASANALRDYWSVTDLSDLGDLIVMDELFDDDMFDGHGVMDMIGAKLAAQNTLFGCGSFMNIKCPATEFMILENFYSQ